MRLSDAARALGATMTGADVEFTAVSTDTRQLPPGCLFVALRGPRFDGHAFVDQAMQGGAAAVMVEASQAAQRTPHAMENEGPPRVFPPLEGRSPRSGDFGVGLLLVADTRLALGRLAAWHRAQMPARLAAITGSNGKTTVKEMLAAILAEEVGAEAVLATAGNLNNDIGVPLTLLRLTPAHRYAVIEMGMNHAGEIDYLTYLARPDVALVNNAMRAHLEGLGSVEAIARAKGEIYAGLKAGGIAIVNADDAFADYWLGLNGGHRVLRFGHAAGADVRISGHAESAGERARALAHADPMSASQFPLVLDTPQGRIETSLRVSGEHNRRNAAAAAAAALALGASSGAVARGLAAFTGAKGRLRVHPCILGATLIDDTYNANPDSMLAAIQVLAARPGHRILVLGDMGELGPDAAALHREVGERAKAAGIERLLGLGEMSAHTAQGFGAGAMHFERIEELLAEIECALGPEVTLLVKGSRFMKMERVVNAFMEGVDCPHASLPPKGADCPPRGGPSEGNQCS